MATRNLHQCWPNSLTHAPKLQCVQVLAVAQRMQKELSVHAACVYGGVAKAEQMDKLHESVCIARAMLCTSRE